MGGAHVGGPPVTDTENHGSVGPHPSAILFQIFTQELMAMAAKAKKEVNMIVGPRR